MKENSALARQYILVTPAKDEEKNLPNLIQSVITQIFKPIVGVIVDDGSTDDTPNIIRKAQEKYEWIQSVQLEEHPRDIGKRYAHVCNTGFDFAIKYCKERNIKYGYIGIVDADIILEKEFFEKLIKEFEKNPKLGIASGSEYYYNSNKELVLEKMRDELPMGCMRLWRKECFDEVGRGYPSSYFPDSVSNVIAKLKGWDLKIFKHIKAIQSRKTHSAEGLWKGYKVIGMSDYYRDYHPLFVVIKGLKYLYCRSPYLGIAYLYGYFISVIRRMEKIDNEEVRNYYRHKHKEIIRYHRAKVRNKLMSR